jgi:hypothetical protein
MPFSLNFVALFLVYFRKPVATVSVLRKVPQWHKSCCNTLVAFKVIATERIKKVTIIGTPEKLPSCKGVVSLLTIATGWP